MVVVVGGGLISSNYLDSTQLQFWLFVVELWLLLGCDDMGKKFDGTVHRSTKICNKL